MGKITYHNFDLIVQGSGQEYLARVTSSPAGEASAEFAPPLPNRAWSEIAAVRAFGSRLFESLFTGEVRSCLRRSLDEVNRQGARLRIRLRLADVPELAALPWECLYDPTNDYFLSLSSETPVVRYLDLPQRAESLAVKPPLKVLGVVSSPADVIPLDVDREWARLRDALCDLEQRGLIALEQLEETTLAALQRQLRLDEYHILHFIGHGDFDEGAQDGVLILEDEGGRSRPVDGQVLGTLLRDHRSLRLATLNACEGARASQGDAFAGVAQRLVQQGIPAVIAMQSELSDEAATTFAHEFYAAIADGYPVDAALTEARKAMFAQGDGVGWGTPVLYMRSPDGQLFEVTARPHPQSKPAIENGRLLEPLADEGRREINTLADGARLHAYERELKDILEQLNRRRLILFIGADLPESLTGLPSRQALADALAAQEGIATGGQLGSVAQQVMNAGFRHEFTEFILNALDTTEKQPQDFHRGVVSLIQKYQIETVITTAYDRLLELTLQQAGTGVNIVVRDSDISFIHPDRPTLIQLYGAAQQQDTLTVTEQDQNALLRGRAKTEILREVQTAFRRNGVLFLGYDLSDPIVGALFDEIAGGQFQRRSYAAWLGLSQQEIASFRSNRNLAVLEAAPVPLMQTLLGEPTGR